MFLRRPVRKRAVDALDSDEEDALKIEPVKKQRPAGIKSVRNENVRYGTTSRMNELSAIREEMKRSNDLLEVSNGEQLKTERANRIALAMSVVKKEGEVYRELQRKLLELLMN